MAFKSPPTSEGSSSSMVLQHWRDGRLVSELMVPKAVHGAVVNDGYFASGAAWACGEDRLAYTAEVGSMGGQGKGPYTWMNASCIHTCRLSSLRPSFSSQTLSHVARERV